MNKLRKIISNVWDVLRAVCWACMLAAEEPDEYEREFPAKKKTR